MVFLSIQEVFSKMPEVFEKMELRNLHTKLQVILDGKEPGNWGIEVEADTIQVIHGIIKSPQITLYADSEDYLKMVNGEMDPIRAYMDGTIRITGDLGMVMSLAPLFKLN